MNVLYEGDCLEILPTIPTGSIDMILCDLPYGTTACKWDTVIPFEPLWAQYKRIIKGNGAIVLFGSEPFSSALRMSNIKQFKYDWIWNKKQSGTPLNAKRQPLKIHEIVSVFGNTPIYSPIMRKGKFRQKGGLNKQPEHTGNVDINYMVTNDIYYPVSILDFSNAKKSGKVHPTQKPVALFEYLIKTYTNEGETVLDNCAGSGTTGVACYNTGRNSIMIEKEHKYCEVILDRFRGLGADLSYKNSTERMIP